MTIQELEALVTNLRNIGNDTHTCEVKEAVGKLPSSIVDTLSAFSNGNGGTIILGLSEQNSFMPAPGFVASNMQNAIVAAGEKLTPVVCPEIEIFPFEGTEILVASVYPLPIEDKPCYVTERGMYRGSYIRTGDGDHRLSKYEVDRLVESNRQPCWDVEVVSKATMADLDEVLVTKLVERQKILHPRIFQHMSEEDVLTNLRIIGEDNGTTRPTLAGLLAIGRYPQKFFPTLIVTFTRYPNSFEETLFNGTAKTTRDYRFLDNQTIVGSIPYLISESVDCVRKNMNTGALIEGAFRKDLPDYPLIAVREAVANALQHRDYSPEGRGSAVNINMYPDRLEILNPGGLFGRVTLEDLGKPGITASRNQFLSTILETTPYPGEGFVVDNRGSGIRAIAASLNQAGMYPAKIYSSLTNFRIVFLKRRRVSAEKRISGNDLEQVILTELDKQPSLSLLELINLSGRSRSLVSSRIKKLVEDGKIEPIEPYKSPKQRYRKIN